MPLSVKLNKPTYVTIPSSCGYIEGPMPTASNRRAPQALLKILASGPMRDPVARWHHGAAAPSCRASLRSLSDDADHATRSVDSDKAIAGRTPGAEALEAGEAGVRYQKDEGATPP